MDNYVDKLTKFMMDSIPEKKIILSVASPGFNGSGAVNTAFANVMLTEPHDRTRSQKDIVNMVNRSMNKFPESKFLLLNLKLSR